MKLSTKSDYSLRMVIYLLDRPEGTRVKVKEVADFFTIPLNHLKVLVNHLVNQGVLISTTGPKGGIELNPEGLSMTVGALLESIESFNLLECFSGETDHCAITGHCKLKGILQKAFNLFVMELRQYCLSDLRSKV